jgi:hypothetical protein
MSVIVQAQLTTAMITEKLPLPFNLWLLFAPGQRMGAHDHWTLGPSLKRW